MRQVDSRFLEEILPERGDINPTHHRQADRAPRSQR